MGNLMVATTTVDFGNWQALCALVALVLAAIDFVRMLARRPFAFSTATTALFLVALVVAALVVVRVVVA